MSTDAFSIALSGMNAATLRISNSAHNVANMTTENFRNRRTVQTASEGGGTAAHTQVDREPAQVDLAREAVDQMVASSQFKANARTIATALDVRGSVLDLFA